MLQIFNFAFSISFFSFLVQWMPMKLNRLSTCRIQRDLLARGFMRMLKSFWQTTLIALETIHSSKSNRVYWVKNIYSLSSIQCATAKYRIRISDVYIFLCPYIFWLLTMWQKRKIIYSQVNIKLLFSIYSNPVVYCDKENIIIILISVGENRNFKYICYNFNNSPCFVSQIRAIEIFVSKVEFNKLWPSCFSFPRQWSKLKSIYEH